MLKLFVTLFVVFVIAENATAIRKCHVCEECHPVDKSTWQTETCVDDDHQCMTVKEMTWALGTPIGTFYRKCAPKGKTCDELYPVDRTIDPLLVDYVPPEYECTFCDTDLCNE